MASNKITYQEVENALANSSDFRDEMRNATFRPVFNNGISAICDNAFKNCKNIVLTSLPSQISVVDTGAFQNCTSLTRFSLPQISCIGKEVFKDCTNLSSFEFSEDNLSIGKYAFENTALLSVRLPSSIDRAADGIFTNCGNLVSASGDNVVSILLCAFQNCSRLSSMDFPKVKFLFRGAFENTNFKYVDLSSVQKIDDSVFRNSKNLETVCLSNCISTGDPAQELFKNYSEDYPGLQSLREIKLPKIAQLEVGIAENLPALSSIDVRNLKQLDIDLAFVGSCPKLSALNLSALESFHGHYIAYNCASLNNVNLQSLLSSSGDRLFCECHCLPSVYLPKYVYSGDGVALNCNKLNAISMPKLLNIYNPIAYSCNSLSAVFAPKLSTLGKHGLFENCENVASVYIDNAILKSINNDSVIVNANDYNDIKYICPKIKVLSLDWLTDLKPYENYFNQLTGIYCPAVASISAGQFKDNNSLKVVELDSVKDIPENAFLNSSSLISASFNSVSSIHVYAFNDCSSLTALNIGNDLQKVEYGDPEEPIYDQLMCDNTKMLSNAIEANEPVFAIDNKILAACLKSITAKYENPNIKIVLPYGMYPCDYQRELDNEVSSIVLPNAKIIGTDAFTYWTESLTDIDIRNAEIIQPYAMYGCSNLSNVIVGEKLKEISIGAFSNTNIKKLNAPNLVFIGNQAFTACENLSSMQCENVTDIGRLAFANCHNLYSLNFPKLSSDDLQSYFMNCTSLSALHIDNDTYKSDQNGYGVEDQIIRNSYNDIIYVCPAIERMSSDVEDTMFTFINCKNLISAYLPNIKVLKHKMFSGCTSMTSANYPTVISVGDSIFSLCDQLKGVYLPNVTKFGNGMFNGCAMLQNADFSQVSSIGDYAFSSCKELTSVQLPNLEYAGKSVFQQCDKLSNVQFEKLSTIEEQSFQQCMQLTAVNIPNVKYAAKMAFSECSSLHHISCQSLSGIGQGAFSKCINISEISLPNVKSIESNAFESCYNLVSAYVPELTSIGSNAFKDTKLTELNAPNVKSVDGNAFDGTWLSAIFVDNDTYHSIDNGYGIENQLIMNADETHVMFGVPGLHEVKINTIDNGQNFLNNCAKLSAIDLVNDTELGGFLITYTPNSTRFNDGLKSLLSVKLHKITSIHGDAFSNIKTLSVLDFSENQSIPALYDIKFYPYYKIKDMFASFDPNYKVLVPANKADEWKSNDYWKDYADHIVTKL